MLASVRHKTTDVVDFHVGRQKSYSTLILDTEKESLKSLEERDNGEVCVAIFQHPLHTELYTTPGLLLHAWEARTYRRATDTHTGDLIGKYEPIAKLLLHIPCYLLIRIIYMRRDISFSVSLLYTPIAGFSGEFLLHVPGYF